MNSKDRIISRIASAGDAHPAASRRFNDRVMIRRSWSLWFLARASGVFG